MTRKDYERFAAVFATLKATPGNDSITLLLTATALGRTFKADNPRFDLARFLAACGF